MSDKLEWLNQHFVLLKYNTMDELIQQGGYELDPKLSGLCPPGTFVQDFIRILLKEEYIKAAVDVLAFAIHRRAGVWWGICCMRKLYDELKEAAEKAEEEKAKAAEEEKKKKAREAAEKKAEDAEKAAQKEAAEKKEEEFAKAAADAKKKIAEVKSKFTPEQKSLYDLVWKETDKQFVQETGMTAMEFIDYAANIEKIAEAKAAEQMKKDVPAEKPEPPKAPAAPAKPEDKSDAPMPPEMKDEFRKNAFYAACVWVHEPSAENSIKANQAADLAKDATEGMLARTAFWSFGNLSVDQGKGVNVPVPAGLAGNGLRSTLLLAMLTDGGVLSPRERAEEYLSLGMEIACGKNNWTSDPEETKEKTDGEDTPPPEPAYKKWK